MPCGKIGLGLANLWALTGEQEQKYTNSAEGNVAFVHCPECNWEITGNFSWCPKCGTRLKPFHCAYCDSIFPGNLTKCPHCGAPIS